MAPPGPRGWPLVGSGPEFWRDPLGFLERGCARYGDTVKYSFGPRQVMVFRHPDEVRAVLVTHQHQFVKGGADSWFRAFAGQGLFTSEGELHRCQRRLAQPAFHRGRIAAYGPIMVERAARMAGSWRAGRTLDLNEEMRELTMGIVCKAVFGVDIENSPHHVGQALTTIMQFFPLFTSLKRYLLRFPSPARKRFEAARARLDATIYDIIEGRRSSGAEGSDFLSTLLQVRDDAGHPISDVQLRDELVTLFIAGHETAANALTWTWHLISAHPAVEAKLHEEVDAILGARRPEAADAACLTYAESVFSEALRLYPPLWVLGRRAMADVEIGRYHVPQGTIAVVSPYLTQRDPAHFPEPLAFLPERWTPAMKAALPKFAYFPFGGGARQCLGDSFAWLESVLVIAVLAQKWRIRVVPGQALQPQALATLRPRAGLQVTLEPRAAL